jgi:hypothetical protein
MGDDYNKQNKSKFEFYASEKSLTLSDNFEDSKPDFKKRNALINRKRVNLNEYLNENPDANEDETLEKANSIDKKPLDKKNEISPQEESVDFFYKNEKNTKNTNEKKISEDPDLIKKSEEKPSDNDGVIRNFVEKPPKDAVVLREILSPFFIIMF